MDAGMVLATYGPWGIIAFAVTAILRGWIVPREVVEDIQKELAITRENNKELVKQRNDAWAETGKVALALSQLPQPPKDPDGGVQ